MRIEQGLELHLAAVDVPLGEVGVHLAVSGHVDLAVAPFVAARDVGDHVRKEQRVVQGRVEGVLLGRRAAAYGDASQEGVPAMVRLRADPLQRPARILRLEILQGVLVC